MFQPFPLNTVFEVFAKILDRHLMKMTMRLRMMMMIQLRKLRTKLMSMRALALLMWSLLRERYLHAIVLLLLKSLRIQLTHSLQLTFDINNSFRHLIFRHLWDMVNSLLLTETPLSRQIYSQTLFSISLFTFFPAFLMGIIFISGQLYWWTLLSIPESFSLQESWLWWLVMTGLMWRVEQNGWKTENHMLQTLT